MLLNGCGPELVDQSEKPHELGGFFGKVEVG